MQRKQYTFYRSFWEVIQKLPTKSEKLQAFEVLSECFFTWCGLFLTPLTNGPKHCVLQTIVHKYRKQVVSPR